jgi:carbohydrate-binding DOMON domain-containing protein
MVVGGSKLKALVLLALLSILVISTPLSSQMVLISVSDPEGDDRGPGYYGYPENPVFKPGVFDIVGFKVVDEGDRLAFITTFKELGGNPWGGPNGFSLQNIQIYVRTTQTGLPARTDTLGLNVVFAPSYAWHFSIIVVPGWEEKIVPEGQRAGVYYYGFSVVQDGVLNVRVDGNSIVASVDKKALIDVDNVASWTIVVAVASYDGFGPNRVRPVGPTGGEWVLHGTMFATPEQRARIAKAIATGIEPRVVDLLVYSPEFKDGITAEIQYTWLDSYNPDLKLLATIPHIEIPPTTVTITNTVTNTIFRTLTELRTEIRTEVQTTTVTQVNWPVSILLLIIGLVVGGIIVRFVVR